MVVCVIDELVMTTPSPAMQDVLHLSAVTSAGRWGRREPPSGASYNQWQLVQTGADPSPSTLRLYGCVSLR